MESSTQTVIRYQGMIMDGLFEQYHTLGASVRESWVNPNWAVLGDPSLWGQFQMQINRQRTFWKK